MGAASSAELRVSFGRGLSAGHRAARGRRRPPFGGAQGRAAALQPVRGSDPRGGRDPGGGRAGLRAARYRRAGVSAGGREGGMDACLPACLPALCLDSNSTLTPKRITCYLTCKLLRKKHLPSNLTKLGMPGKNEIYLNEETRCKLAVSQTAIDSCIDLSSNVSSQ